ncbi:MAG: acyltransferase [Chthoniobacteraceae bacterium]
MPAGTDLTATTPPLTQRSERLPWLDVLRGVAVLLVLLRHLDPLPDSTPDWLKIALAPAMAAGWMGVDLFFVLSGFLVGSLLLKSIAGSRDVSITRFLIRRGFKIYPAFYLLLIVTIAALAGLTGNVPWSRIMAEGLFVQNYLPGIWQHTWSLAVEEHFYLLLAALVGALAWANRSGDSDRFRSLPMIVGTVMLACLFLRTLHYVLLPEQRGAIYRSTHLRIDSLFAGVFVAYVAAFHARAFSSFIAAHRTRIAIGGTLLILPAWLLPLSTTGFAGAFLLTIGFTLLAIGCAGWVAIAACAPSGNRTPPARIWRGVGFIGVYSYSIYLWHLPVKKMFPMICHRLMGEVPGPSVQYAIYFGGTFLLALLTSRLLEFPLLRFRDRFFPSMPARPRESASAPDGPAKVGLAIS